jgi:hypothetical protein
MNNIEILKNKSFKIFGDKFNFDKVLSFKNYNDIITITCNIHGDFDNKISNFIYSKHGCSLCAKEYNSQQRSFTNEEFINKIKNIYGDNFLYDKVIYNNINKDVIIGCKKHGYYNIKASQLLDKTSCKDCKNDEYKNLFINKSKEIHLNKYNYNNIKYINCNTAVEIQCNKHNTFFYQKPKHHINGSTNCEQCLSDKTNKSNECFIKELINTHGDKYKYDKVKYINSKTNVIVTCNKHGDFETISSYLIGKNATGCPKCGTEKTSNSLKMSLEDFLIKAKKVHSKNKFNYDNVIFNSNKDKIDIYCNSCKKSFKQKLSHHISSQCGCPYCNESLGERKISKLLNDKNIKYIPQHKFSNCKYKKVLTFDFYLPEYNLCIEYDGEQHFKPIEWFGGEKSFIETQIRDEIKNKYCKDNDINLLRIPYTDKNIIKTLEEYLLNNTPL